MYPDYGEYWESIYANPERVVPFEERIPSKSEIEYARLALKRQPGKNMYVVGGATFVASLLNEDLIDELRLIVHPIVLGKGQALFSGVNKRLSLDLVQAESTGSGRVVVTYRT